MLFSVYHMRVCQIVCRSSAPLNHDVKVKISNFCHVTEQRVPIHDLSCFAVFCLCWWNV